MAGSQTVPQGGPTTHVAEPGGQTTPLGGLTAHVVETDGQITSSNGPTATPMAPVFDYRNMLILHDSSLDIYAMCNTNDFGFDHYASRDSSRYLLDCTHLATSHPTGVPCAAGWCSTRLSHGPSTSDVDPLGCQLWTTQALHRSHSLPHPKISLGCPSRSSLVGGYGGRVLYPHVQWHLGLGSTPPLLQCCH
jgi:hypothetical protein